MTASLVMVAGSAPGAGKTTLVERLAVVLRAEGESVHVVWEDDVWGPRRVDDQPVDAASGRPEFVELLRGHGVVNIAATFDQVAAPSTADRWLQDWTWQDLAVAVSAQPLTALPRELARRLVNHHATLVYLEIDPQVAVSRALAGRGSIWLSRHAVMLGLPGAASVAEVASWYAEREPARRGRVLSGGVAEITLDASGSIDSVLDGALSALR